MKKSTFFSLFILCGISISINGQTYFSSPNVIIDAKLSPDGLRVMQVEDIDLDGRPDIIFGGQKNIGWYKNNNAPTEEWPVQIIDSEYNYPYFETIDLILSDLDGDNDLDIIISRNVSANHNIYWYENQDGFGQFGPAILIAENLIGSTTIAAADLDNDGDMDIASASFQDNKLAWYENLNGSGGFSEQIIIRDNLLQARGVKAKDIDGDGDIDLSVTYDGFNSKTVWFANDETTDGLSSSSLAILPAGIEIPGSKSNSLWGDIDGDGDEDVLTFGNNEINWHRRTTSQFDYFEYAQTVESEGGDIIQGHLMDVDDDGDMDIVAGLFSLEQLVWYEYISVTGTFGPQQILPTDIQYPHILASVDADLDGDEDLISGSSINSRVSIQYKVDNILSFDQQFISQHTYTVGSRFVQPYDLDGDGDQDIITSTQVDNTIAWFENINGEGDFEKRSIIPDLPEAPIHAIIPSDLDNDGLVDLIFQFTHGDERIVWYKNEDGMGNFSAANIVDDLSTGTAPHAFPIDLDNDGDMDLIVSVHPAGLFWYENLDGQGNFSERILLDDDYPGQIRKVLDLDNDGHMDLVSEPISSTVLAHFNQGNFEFSRVPLALDEYGLNHIDFADLDGDGKVDLLIAAGAPGTNHVVYYRWDEFTGGIKDTIDLDLGTPNHVSAADMDNDGDLDILAAGKDGNTIVSWYENLDGLGHFGTAQVLRTAAATDTGNADGRALVASDIDNDGDMDLISAFTYPDEIAWYENLLTTEFITGNCYLDQNENQMQDPDEINLFEQPINLIPSQIAQFTNTDGSYLFFVSNGTYQVQAQPSSNWQLTTNSLSDTFHIPTSSALVANFGMIPTQEVSKVQPNISAAANRCSFIVPFWLDYENEGTTYSSGLISFKPDGLTTILNASPQADSIADNTYFWYFENLPPTHQSQINLELQMPSVEYLGDTLAYTSKIWIEEGTGNLLESSETQHKAVLNCAYDPNDKIVNPAGIDDEHFTLFDQPLEYTVRFQNTGTDTAFNVRIRDILDPNLDWDSFQTIAYSHPGVTTLDQTNGKVEFIFENILLPDSTTNEVASHGFVKFRIRHKDGLAEYTTIENTANIFFDFNLPIQTNTTWNTLVSEIPFSTSVSTPQQSQSVIQIFPNPFQQDITLQFKPPYPTDEEFQFIIWDTNGRLLNSFPLTTFGNNTFKFTEKRSGFFFYKVINKSNGQIIDRGKLIKLE